MRAVFLLSVSVTAVLAAASSVGAQETFDWSGFYIGGSVGGVGLDVDKQFFLEGSPSGSSWDNDGGGFGLFGTAGYNLTDGNLVYGLEGTVGLLSVEADGEDDEYPDSTAKLSGLAALQGRVGVAFDRALLFGAAGFVAGKLDLHDYSDTDVDSSDTVFGGIFTVGAEYAVTDDLSLRGDVSWLGLGDVETSIDGYAGASIKSEPSAAIAKVGLNFHF